MAYKSALLVTGSAGLIGSKLIAQLIKSGEKVLQLDIRIPPDQQGYGDYCNFAELPALINQCRGVIHLAGISRVIWGEQDPQKCWDINVIGTGNLLEAIYQSSNQPWVIYASSREVYGQQQSLPVKEDLPLTPVNMYARSKVAAEALIKQYQLKGLVSAVLRFSNVYGNSNDYPDRVIPAFCRHALLDQPLRLDGKWHTFDFTHVEDTVRGILAVINKLDDKIKDLPPIHLTTGKSTSLIELVNLIEHILAKPLTYYEAPARAYDVNKFCGDPARAKTILNWEAQISLEQGLTDLIKQYQSQLFSKTIVVERL